jgi:hypothetical protein
MIFEAAMDWLARLFADVVQEAMHALLGEQLRARQQSKQQVNKDALAAEFSFACDQRLSLITSLQPTTVKRFGAMHLGDCALHAFQRQLHP